MNVKGFAKIKYVKFCLIRFEINQIYEIHSIQSNVEIATQKVKIKQRTFKIK